MIGLLKEVIAITENANDFRVLPCFEDFRIYIELAHQPTLPDNF